MLMVGRTGQCGMKKEQKVKDIYSLVKLQLF